MDNDKRVIVEYNEDVPAAPDQPAHLAGERLWVRDAVAAATIHPKAKIVSYANGQPFSPSKDEDFAAYQREEKERKAQEREAAKAAKESADTDEDQPAQAAAKAGKKSSRNRRSVDVNHPDNVEPADSESTDEVAPLAPVVMSVDVTPQEG